MAKVIEKSEVLKKLEKAKSIREEAEKQAKEIESGVLSELKDERKKLQAQMEKIDREIERISGKPVSVGGGKGRINTEATILEIVKEHSKVSCATIEAHPKLIALYAEQNRKVSPQAAKLKSLVNEKKLIKTGKRKKAVYSLA